MTALQLNESPADAGKRVEATIRAYVLRSLDRPETRLRVAVRPLWEHHYRVNVYTGIDDPTAATIAHSYFVVTDPGGTVLRSTPAIRRVAAG